MADDDTDKVRFYKAMTARGPFDWAKAKAEAAKPDGERTVMIQGRTQMIDGKLHIVGKPDSWPEGFDDWEIREGDAIWLLVPESRLTER